MIRRKGEITLRMRQRHYRYRYDLLKPAGGWGRERFAGRATPPKLYSGTAERRSIERTKAHRQRARINHGHVPTGRASRLQQGAARCHIADRPRRCHDEAWGTAREAPRHLLVWGVSLMSADDLRRSGPIQQRERRHRQ
jgi:hypothetical protein